MSDDPGAAALPEVMLVDDERLVARLYARAVEAAGCSATIVGDGEAAFDRVVEQPPRLMLTDLNMPGMSGLDLIARLRDRDLKSFPVILMSADDNVALLQAGVEAGADDFLFKGVPFERIIARLRHWVFGPFSAGQPEHIRAAASDTLVRATPPDPPIAHLHGGIDPLVARTALVLADLLSMQPDDFGANDVDCMRLLGVIDGIIALLTRSNALAQLRRLEAVKQSIDALDGAWPDRLQPLLADYPRIAEAATFRHAAQTLLLRP